MTDGDGDARADDDLVEIVEVGAESAGPLPGFLEGAYGERGYAGDPGTRR